MYVHYTCSAQNNSRPLVNFLPNDRNDLAKQLIVCHNDLTIGLNKVEGSMLRVTYTLFTLVLILPHVKENWKWSAKVSSMAFWLFSALYMHMHTRDLLMSAHTCTGTWTRTCTCTYIHVHIHVYMYMYMLCEKCRFGPSSDFCAQSSDSSSMQKS